MVSIGVGDELGKPLAVTEPQLALNDDGYYWFLHSLFGELHEATGQYIDLYGDAVFTGPGLDALERILSKARRLVAVQPEAWEVHTGTQELPVRREIYKSVERAEFLRLLGVWEQAVARARQTGRAVVCFGD
jgi:hypothetical protein